MRDAEGMIDRLIQEFAEEMPLIVIQKLGEIRKALVTEETGQSTEAGEVLGRSVNKIAREHGVSLINIAMFPVSMDVMTMIHSSQASEKDIARMVMQIPKITSDLINNLDRLMPGFGAKIKTHMIMEDIMKSKMTPERKE